jgi:hypothetical protein
MIVESLCIFDLLKYIWSSGVTLSHQSWDFYRNLCAPHSRSGCSIILSLVLSFIGRTDDDIQGSVSMSL